MPQESLSSTTQSIGNAGPLILAYSDTTGATAPVSVSFIPTLAKMVNPKPGPLQRVNLAVGGQIHVFQFSPNESLQWDLVFTDIPYYDNDPRIPRSQGFQSLQRFIRYTLNYHTNVCTVTTPDGFIETMQYIGGLESFQEALGHTEKVTYWTGQLSFLRVIL